MCEHHHSNDAVCGRRKAHRSIHRKGPSVNCATVWQKQEVADHVHESAVGNVDAKLRFVGFCLYFFFSPACMQYSVKPTEKLFGRQVF